MTHMQDIAKKIIELQLTRKYKTPINFVFIYLLLDQENRIRDEESRNIVQ